MREFGQRLSSPKEVQRNKEFISIYELGKLMGIAVSVITVSSGAVQSLIRPGNLEENIGISIVGGLTGGAMFVIARNQGNKLIEKNRF